TERGSGRAGTSAPQTRALLTRAPSDLRQQASGTNPHLEPPDLLRARHPACRAPVRKACSPTPAPQETGEKPKPAEIAPVLGHIRGSMRELPCRKLCSFSH